MKNQPVITPDSTSCTSKVSFIVPCFNEADNVRAFYEEFATVFNEADVPWQLVFVDDGSKDSTYANLVGISEAAAAKCEDVIAIRFSRNFGKEAAVYAGLRNCTGNIVGIIDADLQQPPSDALAMVRMLEADPDADCVAAYQETRHERGMLKAAKESFYKVFGKITGLNALQNASDFRVFRRNVADAILELPETLRFSKGIFSWIGFDTLEYPYTPRIRVAGESKWTVRGLTKYAIDGMFSFSTGPLRLATILGLFFAFLAIVYSVVIVAQTLMFGIDVPGYATTIVTVLFIGGVQLFCLGIIGEYLSRAYIEGKNRPIYIEKSRIESLPSANACDLD